MLCYASCIYSSQLDTGVNCEHQVRTYFLVFSAENIEELARYSNFYTVFSFKSDQSPPVVLDEGIFLVLVELAKFNKANIEGLNARGLWCYLLKNSSGLTHQECIRLIERGGEEMEEALGRLLDISQNEEFKKFVESREKQLRGQRANEMGAREEGVEEGLAKGREEGVEEGLKQIVRYMLSSGKADQEIAQLTGLSKSTIQSLKD